MSINTPLKPIVVVYNRAGYPPQAINIIGNYYISMGVNSKDGTPYEVENSIGSVGIKENDDGSWTTSFSQYDPTSVVVFY